MAGVSYKELELMVDLMGTGLAFLIQESMKDIGKTVNSTVKESIP